MTGNLVIGIAVAMFAVEFITDKVAYLDSAWDSGPHRDPAGDRGMAGGAARRATTGAGPVR